MSETLALPSCDLWEEQERVKRLQLFQETLLPLAIKPIVPLGLSPLSSLTEAPKIDPPAPSTLQPKLELPRVHYMYDIAKLYDRIESLVTDYTVQLKGQTQIDLTQLERLSEANIQKIQEHARAMAAKQTWDTFTLISQYIASSTSIVLGIGLVSTGAGAVAGGFLIAAGALGLTNRIATDLGAWHALTQYFTKSQELQQQYTQWIDLAVSGISFVTTVTSLICAYQAGTLAMSGADLAQKISQVLALSSTAAGAGTRIGSAHSNKQGLELLADLKEIEMNSFLVRQQLKSNSSEFVKNNEARQTAIEQFKRIADASGNSAT